MSILDKRREVLEAAKQNCGPNRTSTLQAAGTIKPGADSRKEPPGS